MNDLFNNGTLNPTACCERLLGIFRAYESSGENRDRYLAGVGGGSVVHYSGDRSNIFFPRWWAAFQSGVLRIFVGATELSRSYGTQLFGEIFGTMVHRGTVSPELREHSYFRACAEEVASWVVAAAESGSVGNFHSVDISGHSLGGATAQLACLRLQDALPNKVITCFAVGSPKPVYGPFSFQADRRWVMLSTAEDPISRVPPDSQLSIFDTENPGRIFTAVLGQPRAWRHICRTFVLHADSVNEVSATHPTWLTNGFDFDFGGHRGPEYLRRMLAWRRTTLAG